MKTFVAFLFLVFLSVLFCSVGICSSIKVGGSIPNSIKWEADTIKITNNVIVELPVILTINAGTIVEFQGNFNIEVKGQIHAIGSETRKILFTVADTTGFYKNNNSDGGWKGIYFPGSGILTGRSILKNCIIERVKHYSPALRIGYFEKEGPIIENCIISKNKSYSIVSIADDNIIFKNCLISNNESYDGLNCTGVFFNPHLDARSVSMINCTVANNKGTGVVFSPSGYLTKLLIENSIIFGNKKDYAIKQMSITGPGSGPNGEDTLYRENNLKILYSLIGSSKTEKWFNNTCLDTNPLFVNTKANNFNLTWDAEDKSPCIDAGNPFSKLDNDSSRRDMGAFFFYQLNRAHKPTALFTTDTTTGYTSKLAVHFNDKSYAGNGIAKWEWDFGDGNTAIIQNPLHTYTLSGIFSVSLTITSVDGSVDKLYMKDYIKIRPGFRINKGEVEGIWKKDLGPYYVYGNITVPLNKTLTIESGTKIEFQDKYQLRVKGSLVAVGLPDSPIHFDYLPEDTLGLYKNLFEQSIFNNLPYFEYLKRGWRGIYFDNTDLNTDSSFVSHCTLTNIRSIPVYTNSVQNKDGYYTGSIILVKSSKARISNNKILNNIINASDEFDYFNAPLLSRIGSPGVLCVVSNPIIKSNLFTNNYNPNGHTGITAYFSTPIIHNNKFRRNNGNIILIKNGISEKKLAFKSFIISNNTFENNKGWAINLEDSKSLILIKNNKIEKGSVAIKATRSSNIQILNNIIRENLAGVFLEHSNNIRIINNLFLKNNNGQRIGNVGACAIDAYAASDVLIANNTILENKASSYQAGAILAHSRERIYNNIIRNNSIPEIQGYDTNEYNQPFLTTLKEFKFNNFKFTTGDFYSVSKGNIDSDPVFNDPSINDYSLKESSLSIDAGSPDTTNLNLPLKDLAGLNRFSKSGKIDMGAYEFHPINAAPTDLHLSNNYIQENQGKNSFVGKFSSSDKNIRDKHFYALTPGNGDFYNSYFSIKTDSLYLLNKVSNLNIDSLSIRVRTTDSENAYFEKNVFLKIDKVTGIISKEVLEQIVKIYPNPISGSLNVKVDQNMLIQKPQLYISTVLGQLKVYQKITSTLTSLDVSDFSKGIYIFIIENSNKEILYKKSLIVN